jgi:hypothetical protein
VPVDQQILVAGTSAVPVIYTVPNAIEAALLCVNATIDGTGASGQFLSTVEIVSDGGVVVARCPCFTTLAVGGTAEISWFRMRDQSAVATSNTTPYENLIFSTGGLVLYWKLDDAIGSTATADSFGANPGTVFGAVSFGQPKLADVTSALYTAGMTGRKVNSPGVQGTGKMTALVWIKTTAAAATNVIAWADNSAADGRWFQWSFNAAGVMTVSVFDIGALGYAFTGTVPINDGAKHMIAFTIDATNPVTGAGMVGSIYVDNALDTATPIVTPGNPLADHNKVLVLGARWRNAGDGLAGNLQLAGTLDEFAVFTSALSLSQLQAINTAGRVV